MPHLATYEIRDVSKFYLISTPMSRPKMCLHNSAKRNTLYRVIQKEVYAFKNLFYKNY
jgi:hypothetical protein